MKNKKLFSVVRFIVISFTFFCFYNSVFARIEIENKNNNTNFRTCDGSFDLVIEADDEYMGLAQPFDITISHEGGGVNIPPIVGYTGENSIPTFDNLCFGTYAITVINKYGCESTIFVDIMSCDQTLPSIIITDINHTKLPTTNTGNITVAASSEGIYTFEWSNGEIGPSVSNLASGTYTVTLSNGDCSTTKSIKIESCEVETIIYEPDPQIDFIPNPEIPFFEIKTVGGLGIDGEDFIELKVLVKEDGESNYKEIDLERYTINWQNGAESGRIFKIENSQLAIENIGGKVIVTVNNGCQTHSLETYLFKCGENSLTDDQKSTIFVKNSINPCSWSNPDGTSGEFNNGSFLLNIPNPNNEEVILSIEGLNTDLFQINNKQGYSEVEIFGLGVNRYRITISLGDCNIIFSYLLEGKPLSKRFMDYSDFAINNDEGVCRYQRLCNGVIIDTLGEFATIDYDGAISNAWGKCEAPIYCNDKFIKNKKFPKVKTKGYKYLKLLESAYYIENRISEGQYFRITQDVQFQKLQWCENTRFCPVTFEVHDITHPIEDTQRPTVINHGNSCYTVKCEKFLREDFSFCLGTEFNDIPGYIPSEEILNCAPASYSLFEIYHALDYFQTIPEFSGSELENLVLTRGTSQEAKCSNILFCWSDFSVKRSDLNEVSCETLVQQYFVELDGNGDPVYGVDEFETCLFNGESVRCCRNNLCVTGNLYYRPFTDIGPNYGGGGFQESIEENIITKFIVDTFYNEELVNFGKIHTEEFLIPLGIQKFRTNYITYDYSHFAHQLEKTDKYNILFFNHQEEEFITAYIQEKFKDSLHTIQYNNDYGIDWNIDYYSNDFISTKGFWKNNDIIKVAGTFIDSLYYDTTFLNQSNSQSIFLLTLDTVNSLLSTTTIQNLDSTLIFSENQNGEILLASPYQGDNIIVNEVTQKMNITDGLMIANINANNEVQIKQTLVGNDSLQLLDLAYANNGTQYTIALANVDSLAIGGTTILDTTQKQLVLLTFDATDALLQTQTFPMENINTNKFDLIYGEGEDLFVGLTFSNTLSVLGTDLISNGQEDIALLKIDSLGNLEWQRTYGTVDNENVSQLMYDNTVVFFGGEFNGSTQTRDIGNYRFINLTNSQQRAYISYVFDEIPTATAAVARSKPTQVEKPIIGPISTDVKVYPNPFSNSFTVSFDALQAGNTQITVTDMMGKEVHTMNYDTQIGKNEIEINTLEHATGGVYYISVHREAEKQQSSHKIIHLK